MKRSPNDYTIEDVEIYLAHEQGMTLAQVLALDFPQADYTDENDAPIWEHDTVLGWLNTFNPCRIATDEAHTPGTVESLIQLVEYLDAEGKQCR